MAYTVRMATTRIYSWNVNGIRAVLRKGDFEKFLNEQQPDVLCLQEIKAQQDQVDIDFPEYEEYWTPAERKGYSGSAIFSKNKPIEVMRNLPGSPKALSDDYGDANAEGRVTVAEYDDFFVVSCYTVNVKDDLSRVPLRMQWDKAMLRYLQKLEKKKPVIYCGDLNVAHTEDDLARPKENRGKRGFTDEERAGLQTFFDAGFVDTFRIFTQGNGHYTWWSPWARARERNVGWRIDYILVSAALKGRVVSATIHADVMGSDHCPVSIEIA